MINTYWIRKYEIYIYFLSIDDAQILQQGTVCLDGAYHVKDF